MAAAAVSINMCSLHLSIPAQILFKIERAFKMYHSGEHKDVGQFSRDKVGDMIDDYMVPASELSDRRWTTILEKCGSYSNESDDEYAGPSAQSMQNSRRALYTPSSLTKDDE
jgi:hypothetical protein